MKTFNISNNLSQTRRHHPCKLPPLYRSAGERLALTAQNNVAFGDFEKQVIETYEILSAHVQAARALEKIKHSRQIGGFAIVLTGPKNDCFTLVQNAHIPWTFATQYHGVLKMRSRSPATPRNTLNTHTITSLRY